MELAKIRRGGEMSGDNMVKSMMFRTPRKRGMKECKVRLKLTAQADVKLSYRDRQVIIKWDAPACMIHVSELRISSLVVSSSPKYGRLASPSRYIILSERDRLSECP